jgi:hypothetical protein
MTCGAYRHYVLGELILKIENGKEESFLVPILL